jgi:hypothetical protein
MADTPLQDLLSFLVTGTLDWFSFLDVSLFSAYRLVHILCTHYDSFLGINTFSTVTLNTEIIGTAFFYVSHCLKSSELNFSALILYIFTKVFTNTFI